MAHCYECRVEIIIIIFVQVVLDVVDKSTALTDSFHFFTYFTLVPEVFLDFSSRKRSRASREAATTSRESDEEREKPLVTLASNLTFMQTTAVKRVKLLIKRVTNGNLANTCLSAAIFF